MLELYHISYAVKDLDRALVDLHDALGGRPTEPQDFDMLVHLPLEGGKPRRVKGRSAWLVAQPTPIELWDGGPDTPWGLPDGSVGPRMHHHCFWADDLDAVAVRLEAVGFERELTPVHNGPGLLGFCYLRNEEGMRIEIMSSIDKPSVHNWLTKGTPKRLSWMQYTK